MRGSSLMPLKLSLLRYMTFLITVLLMCFSFFSKLLQACDELFIIFLFLISLYPCSHGGFYRRGRTWTRSYLSEPSLIRSHPGDKGIPLIRWDDSSLLPHDRPFPKSDVRSLLMQEFWASKPHSQTVSVLVTYCMSYWKYCINSQMLLLPLPIFCNWQYETRRLWNQTGCKRLKFC